MLQSLEPVHAPGRDQHRRAERATTPAPKSSVATPAFTASGKPSFSGETLAMPASLMIQESVTTVGQTAS